MTDLGERLRAHVGRYLEKQWDWHAFPANDGYPELERAQMRYIGAGGSPKTDDATTLAPGAFSCSLIYQEPGRKASIHHHRIEELFFVHSGTLTMTWQFGDETIDFVCRPGDAVLNPPERPHGFRNDGPEPCVMQIMVATAGPMLPTYTDHPADHPASPFRPAPPERRAGYLAEIEPYVARAGDDGLRVDGPHFSFFVETLKRGVRPPAYARAVEEAFMVIDGVLDVELDDGSQTVTTRLGVRDLILVPPGLTRRLANTDAGPVRFAAIVGEPAPTPFPWKATAATGRA